MQNEIINKTRYKRLLESHMSLENLLEFLKANDLRHVSKILLCHLSNTNASSNIMKEQVYKQTKIETVIAESGLTLKLNQYPF